MSLRTEDKVWKKLESDPDRQVHAGVSCILGCKSQAPGAGGRGPEGSGGQWGAGLAQDPPYPRSPRPHITAGGRPSYSALSVRAAGLGVRRMEKGSRKRAAHTV